MVANLGLGFRQAGKIPGIMYASSGRIFRNLYAVRAVYPELMLVGLRGVHGATPSSEPRSHLFIEGEICDFRPDRDPAACSARPRKARGRTRRRVFGFETEL